MTTLVIAHPLMGTDVSVANIRSNVNNNKIPTSQHNPVSDASASRHQLHPERTDHGEGGARPGAQSVGKRAGREVTSGLSHSRYAGTPRHHSDQRLAEALKNKESGTNPRPLNRAEP